MLRSVARPRLRLRRATAWRSQSSARHADPLRILFCGSDQFSVTSLDALNDERKTNPELIESIDVVCRPGKRTGPGLKVIKDVPIHPRALELGLPLTHLDTFTGWTPPPTAQGHAINLIVAVSFGLLVPPRLLNAAKYGGLNVHPSLLPQFRGPAPVHHTLLAGHEYTGVTLQTLHPSKMDHGAILAQTPRPGIRIPKVDRLTSGPDLAELLSVQALTQDLAGRGATILVDGLRRRLFAPPVRDLAPELDVAALGTLASAPKITPEQRRIDWATWPADKIDRYDFVIGPLWSEVREAGSETVHRVKWGGRYRNARLHEKHGWFPPRCADLVPLPKEWHRGPGVAYLFDDGHGIMVGTTDGRFLASDHIQISGLGKGLSPVKALLKAGIISQRSWRERDPNQYLYQIPNAFY